jgi:hypothetical protein
MQRPRRAVWRKTQSPLHLQLKTSCGQLSATSRHAP